MEYNVKELIKRALDAQSVSYSPYSQFKVGASLLCGSGKVYTGANIENASYPAGICAERVVYSKAISEGEKEFVALCVTSSNTDKYTFPCGICREFISEFSVNTKIIVAKNTDEYLVYELQDLLPRSFGKDVLNNK